jgi:hypothetical protein
MEGTQKLLGVGTAVPGIGIAARAHGDFGVLMRGSHTTECCRPQTRLIVDGSGATSPGCRNRSWCNGDVSPIIRLGRVGAAQGGSTATSVAR